MFTGSFDLYKATRRGRTHKGAESAFLLTQKMKLKKKSMYLMHLVQPSTPMVLRNSCLRRRVAQQQQDDRPASQAGLKFGLKLAHGGNTQLLPPAQPQPLRGVQSEQSNGATQPISAQDVESEHNCLG